MKQRQQLGERQVRFRGNQEVLTPQPGIPPHQQGARPACLRRLAVFLRSLEVIAALQRQLGLQQVGRSLAARLLLVIGECNGAK